VLPLSSPRSRRSISSGRALIEHCGQEDYEQGDEERVAKQKHPDCPVSYLESDVAVLLELCQREGPEEQSRREHAPSATDERNDEDKPRQELRRQNLAKDREAGDCSCEGRNEAFIPLRPAPVGERYEEDGNDLDDRRELRDRARRRPAKVD